MSAFPPVGLSSRAMRLRAICAGVALAAFSGVPGAVRADEGGVSFWVPGQYASLAATPPAPGVYLGSNTYGYSGDVSHHRTLPIGLNVAANVDGNFAGEFASLLLAPKEPVLNGGQLSVSLTGAYAKSAVTADVSIGPRTGRVSDKVWGFGDLYPTLSVAWNKGVNNWMTYLTGDIPVGAYDPHRLANIGIGHAAIDAGGAYTYLNPKSGRELSVTAGFTYNFEDWLTNYQNGVDFHLDWEASQFLNQQVYIGLVGYWYQQLTDDSGSGARLGPFKSSVASVGPEVGYIFNVNGHQASLSGRAYWEFQAEHRLEGWAGFITLALPLNGPAAAKPK